MPKLTLTNSKAGTGSKSDGSGATTTTPTGKSPIKQMVVKKVKSVWHHVMHPHHRHRVPSSPIVVVRPDQSSVTGSVHSRDTWDVKYAKEISGIEPPVNHSIDLSISTADSSTTSTHIDIADENYLSQEEPQSILQQPMVLPEVETPDPFLIDDDGEEEGVSLSEEEQATSQKAISPTQAVPLDLSSLPQPQAVISPLLNLQKDTPLPPSESEEEYVPDIYVPALIVPTMFLPIPNVRRLFSSNLLTWWLARNSMYDTRY